MAWTIHTWSAETESGSIRSPHFKPVAFDSTANVDSVDDFREGETVLVELEGAPPDFRVLSVRPTHQRQPPNTHCAAFDDVNNRFGDVIVEDSSAGSLQLWLGDCCEYCTPNPVRLRFEGIVAIDGLHDDVDFCDPLFRLASDAELRSRRMAAPPGTTAFCIVTSHGQGADGPPILIVANSIEVVAPSS